MFIITKLFNNENTMDKLSMCRICLVENVRMCVVTNKSLLGMYEKLTGVPFVTEDRKPMLACFFCCTRLKQCCQLQRKCVEAEELLAQMLSEDYEQKPLANRGHMELFGRFIITPIENLCIVGDCQIGCDAIKQELPAVCETHDDVELQPAHLSEELDPEDLYSSHPDVEAHHSESESEEDQIVMDIKIEGEKLSEKPSIRDRQKAATLKKQTLKRKLEDTVPVMRKKEALADSKMIRTTETSTSESVAKIKKPKSFNSIQHTRRHIGKKLYKCDICRRSFGLKSGLERHYRTHTGEKPYKCVVCQHNFADKSSLIYHIRTHTGERPHKCDVCQNSFVSKNHLSKHVKKHFSEKSYKCDVCQHSFWTKHNLEEHFRKHSGEKPFKCDVCQRSFRFKGSLNRHSQTHTGEKPYKCDVCKNSFSSKSTLARHLRTHLREESFKCHQCQRSFSGNGGLKRHFRKKSGEKPFKCDVCQRSYCSKNSLNRHSRTHTG